MTVQEFNDDLTKVVRRAIRDGVNRKLMTLAQIVGVLDAHQKMLTGLNADLRAKQIAGQIADGAVPPV
jgi:hypothetical protein